MPHSQPNVLEYASPQTNRRHWWFSVDIDIFVLCGLQMLTWVWRLYCPIAAPTMPGNLQWSLFARVWRSYWDGDNNLVCVGLFSSLVLAIVALRRSDKRYVGYVVYMLVVVGAAGFGVAEHSYLLFILSGPWGAMLRGEGNPVHAADMIIAQPAFWLLVVRLFTPGHRMVDM